MAGRAVTALPEPQGQLEALTPLELQFLVGEAREGYLQTRLVPEMLLKALALLRLVVWVRSWRGVLLALLAGQQVERELSSPGRLFRPVAVVAGDQPQLPMAEMGGRPQTEAEEVEEADTRVPVVPVVPVATVDLE